MNDIQAEISDINGNVEIKSTDVFISILQDSDHVCLRKKGAAELIKVLQEWIGNE
jgi:hypothetical protein